MKLPEIPTMTREGSELVLLGLIAAGVIWLLGKIIDKGGDGYDLAAFLLVLQAIITAIKDRWTQRGTDNAMATIATRTPATETVGPPLGDAPSGKPGDPVHVQEEPKL